MTAAKYIRLSSADEDIRMGDKAESNSVVNQRKLLDCYLESHREFSNCTILEFLDDGRSGTNLAGRECAPCWTLPAGTKSTASL